MSNGNRVTQHKAKRETEAKERASLKRENKALKKQISKLRRRLQHLEETQIENEEIAQDDVESMGETLKVVIGDLCPNCGGANMTTIIIPNGTLHVCKDCKHRSKKS